MLEPMPTLTAHQGWNVGWFTVLTGPFASRDLCERDLKKAPSVVARGSDCRWMFY